MQLRGSKAVEAANERFDATMTNVVRWQEAPGGGKQIASDTTICVQLQVPRWFMLPTAAIERTGALPVWEPRPFWPADSAPCLCGTVCRLLLRMPGGPPP